MKNKYYISSGPHEERSKGMCAMEWVAFLAGEEHSDQPKCVSPTLNQFCVLLNDSLPNKERQKLRPYLARAIGTRDDGLNVARGVLIEDFKKRAEGRITGLLGRAYYYHFGTVRAANVAGNLRRLAHNHLSKNKRVEAYKLADELLVKTFELLDAMLPKEVIEIPVVEEWQEVCMAV